MAHGGSRPAQGNARMVIPRGYFGLPGQSFSRRRRYSLNIFFGFTKLVAVLHLQYCVFSIGI